MLGRRTWSCIAVIAAISTVAFLYQSKVNLVVFTSLPTKCNSCNQKNATTSTSYHPTTPTSVPIDECSSKLENGVFEVQQAREYWLRFRPTSRPLNVENLQTEVDARFQLYNKIYSEFSSIHRRRLRESMRYNYSINVSTNPDGSPAIYIKEYRDGMPTSGGSGFLVRSIGQSIVICNTKDFFNGSYKVLCPKLEGCSNITIKLQMTEFEAYAQRPIEDVRVPLMRVLKKIQWCIPNVKNMTKFNGEHCKNKRLDEFTKGKWWNVNGEWKWGTCDRCLLNFISQEELNICYKKMTSVTFIGDSHMRNTGDYFLELLGYNMLNITYHRHDDLKISNINILFGPYPSLAGDRISALVQNEGRNFSSSDVLVIMPGSWEFWMRGPVAYFQEAAGKLIKIVTHLKKHIAWRNIKVVWVHQLAFSDRNTQAGFRDNFLTLAANRYIEDELHDLGIDPVDSMHVTYPRFDTTAVCGCHYICREYGDYSKSVGPTGKVLAQLIFKKMCEDF